MHWTRPAATANPMPVPAPRVSRAGPLAGINLPPLNAVRLPQLPPQPRPRQMPPQPRPRQPPPQPRPRIVQGVLHRATPAQGGAQPGAQQNQQPPVNNPPQQNPGGTPPDGAIPPGGNAAPADGAPVDFRGNVDDQDRPLNYYTPLQDIFLRPALPSLGRPFLLTATGALCYAAPGQALYNFAMTQALYQSKNTFKSAALHLAGNFVKYTSMLVGDILMKVPSWTAFACGSWLSDKLYTTSHDLLIQAAKQAAPTIMQRAKAVQTVCAALNICSKPIILAGLTWAAYTIARHVIEPPPYEAPPGTYPNGGPIIEITQQEAQNKAMVFTCPANLARAVQERVLLCERDVTLIQKVKSIAARWCDQNNLQGSRRYEAISGALAAALTVPCIEQNVLQLASSHAVQQQYSRLQRYLSGIKHTNDPWWSKYLLIRR